MELVSYLLVTSLVVQLISWSVLVRKKFSMFHDLHIVFLG